MYINCNVILAQNKLFSKKRNKGIHIYKPRQNSKFTSVPVPPSAVGCCGFLVLYISYSSVLSVQQVVSF